jgi:hypothetical protein
MTLGCKSKKNRSGQKLPDLLPAKKMTEDKKIFCARGAKKN